MIIFHIRKLYEYIKEFANFDEQTTLKQVIDILSSLNLKIIYKKKEDLLIYVIFKTEAALFNIYSKFIYISNRRIKELFKGHNWNQRKRFY